MPLPRSVLPAAWPSQSRRASLSPVVGADYSDPIVVPRNKHLPPPSKGRRTGPVNKRAIVALIEHGRSIRSFPGVVADEANMAKIVHANIDHECRPHTDESRVYVEVGGELATHDAVKRWVGIASVTMSTPTQPRACSRSSCAASISTAVRSTCTVTSPSSTSGTITSSRLGLTIWPAQRP